MVFASQPRFGSPLLLEVTAQGAHVGAELGRASGSFAMPKGQTGWLPRSRRDRDLVQADALDAPGARAELKHVAHPAFVDELLVELAEAWSAFAQLDRVEALVRDG